MSATEIKGIWTPAAQLVAARHGLTGAEYRLVELFAIRRDTVPNDFVVTSAEVMAVVACRQPAVSSNQSSVNSNQSSVNSKQSAGGVA